MTRDEIVDRLDQIESKESVRILFACESGSRAWGFASTDSDFDVRFLYIRPVEWYLSIRDRRDVLEYPIDGLWDVNGWDFKKALQLLQKSNPPLLEWIASPIIYRELPAVMTKLRAIREKHFSPKSCLYHYLSMARNNYRETFQNRDEVKLKKYLYVLRPLLACSWIERTDSMAPTEFSELLRMQVCADDVRQAIEDLLRRKSAGTELGVGPRVPILHDFCEREIERLQSSAEAVNPGDPINVEQLDELFQEALTSSWR